jgi:hypothetical protein
MERRDIDDERSTTGAQELLASAAHLAYIRKGRNTPGDSSRLFLDSRPGRDLLGHVITEGTTRHASAAYSQSSSLSSTRATWRPAPTPIPYVTT